LGSTVHNDLNMHLVLNRSMQITANHGIKVQNICRNR
jgi:hypothetical protein